MLKKELKFLSATKAREFSSKFNSTKRYNRETLRIIRKIERDIVRASKNGLYSISYSYMEVTSGIDVEKIKSHFKQNGFDADIKYKYTSTHSGTTYNKYDIDIQWHDTEKKESL